MLHRKLGSQGIDFFTELRSDLGNFFISKLIYTYIKYECNFSKFMEWNENKNGL